MKTRSWHKIPPAAIMDPVDKLKPEMLEKFFYFLTMRQEIWWQRSQGYPYPWTVDPVLRDNFFCNVYRELDRGTQYLLKNIIPKSGKGGYTNLLFQIMLYRLFNEPWTYRAIAPHDYRKFNGEAAAAILDQKIKEGDRIFRGAWMTSGANVKGMSKARAYCLELGHIAKRMPDIYGKAIAETDSMETTWKVIAGEKWFGGFSAYQVVLDLSYIPIIKAQWLDYDKWVYPGPGARLGLLWMCGKKPVRRKGAGVKDVLSERDCKQLIYHLQKNQKNYFAGFRLYFRYWNNKPLDIHNVEFSLCEFNKYMRAHHGGKKKQYVPPGGKNG